MDESHDIHRACMFNCLCCGFYGEGECTLHHISWLECQMLALILYSQSKVFSLVTYAKCTFNLNACVCMNSVCACIQFSVHLARAKMIS